MSTNAEEEKSTNITTCAYSDSEETILPKPPKEQRWQKRLEEITSYWDDRQVLIVKEEMKRKEELKETVPHQTRKYTILNDGIKRTVDENLAVVYGEGRIDKPVPWDKDRHQSCKILVRMANEWVVDLACVSHD